MENTHRNPTSLRHQIAGDMTFDDQGPASLQQVLDRLSSARSNISSHANRLALISIFLSCVYVVKIAGLRLDLVIFDQKIFEVPYGIFVFCITSQICFIIAISRLMDARVFDRYILGICEKAWPGHSTAIYKTFHDQSAWIEPTALALHHKANKDNSLFSKILLYSFSIIGLVVYTFPIGCGFWFVASEHYNLEPEYQTARMIAVIFTTILSLLWTFAYIALLSIDND